MSVAVQPRQRAGFDWSSAGTWVRFLGGGDGSGAGGRGRPARLSRGGAERPRVEVHARKPRWQTVRPRLLLPPDARRAGESDVALPFVPDGLARHEGAPPRSVSRP